MTFSIDGDNARDVQEALKNYIQNNVVAPLANDKTVKNTVVQDLRNRTKIIAETSAGVSALGKAMEGVSKRGIKELTNSLFDLSKGTKTAKGALKKELASLTEELLQVITSNIRIGQVATPSPQAGKNGGVLGGIFDFASGLLGFRAGGGAVAPNNAFIVGERGPELLVTGRTSGQVIPNGSGSRGASSSVNVTVVNNAGADVSVRQKQGSNGSRELEILVDTMVAKSLTNGNSKAFQALENTYGMRPILNGR